VCHLDIEKPLGHLGIKGWVEKHERIDNASRGVWADVLPNCRGRLMSKRMKLPQKDWNSLKRYIEETITARGGSFEDKRAKKGVKSVYRYGDKERATVWHTSYSDTRFAIHNQKSYIMTYLFADIGLLATNKTQETVIADFLQAAEISRNEYDALQHENDNDVVQEGSVLDIHEDENADADADDPPIVTDPADWLDYAVIKQRQNAVIALFESWGDQQKWSKGLGEKYKSASGWSLDQKEGVESDGNDDYGLWVLAQEDIFLAGEKHINCPEVFWGLFGLLWTQFGSSNSRWQAAWSRGNRLQTHLKERVRLCEGWYGWDAGAYISDYLQKRNLNDEITVYRWFYAKDGESIRVSDDKSSDGWFVQNEGRGYAYSLSKSKATSMTVNWLNKHFLRKAFNRDEGEVDKNLAKWKPKAQHAIWDGSQRVWVGTYKVKKRDIVGTCISGRDEEEIIAENARLMRYEVLTFQDGYAAAIIRKAFLVLGKSQGKYVQLNHKYDKKVFPLIKKEIKNMVQLNRYSLRDIFNQDPTTYRRHLTTIVQNNLALEAVPEFKENMGHLAIKNT
jgi:hypothetical protein